MNEKDFELLMRIVKGKGQADIRGAEVERILKELLTGEFAEVRERKFKIMLKRPGGGGCAAINKIDGIVYVWIDPDFRQESLKAILRHELLHALTDLDDHDPRFKQEARRRGIDIWRV